MIYLIPFLMCRQSALLLLPSCSNCLFRTQLSLCPWCPFFFFCSFRLYFVVSTFYPCCLFCPYSHHSLCPAHCLVLFVCPFRVHSPFHWDCIFGP